MGTGLNYLIQIDLAWLGGRKYTIFNKKPNSEINSYIKFIFTPSYAIVPSLITSPHSYMAKLNKQNGKCGSHARTLYIVHTIQ